MTNQEFIQKNYLKNPYMRKLSDNDFIQRFNLILENMCFVDDNAKISLGTPNNERDFFWFRHWIEICKEAENRNIYGNDITNIFFHDKTHDFLEKINIEKLKEVRKSIGNNKYLYKYGKKLFLEKLLYSGSILLRPASFYADSSLNTAIRDDELTRFYILNSNYAEINFKIKNQSENHCISNGYYIKNFETDYYIFCVTSKFEPRLFNDFEAESCLVIKQPNVFISKIKNILPNNIFKFEYQDIAYFDPLLDNPLSVTIPFSKNFKYSYQNEYRMAFIPYEKKENFDSLNVNIGSIVDFAEIIDIF